MIDVSALPAVRARVETVELAKDGLDPALNEASATQAPGYPSKKLVVENGRYVVAEPTK